MLSNPVLVPGNLLAPLICTSSIELSLRDIRHYDTTL